MSKKTETKEVAVAETNAVSTVDPGGLFDLSDNMEGVRPEIPKIKIIHQGQQFKMPDGTKQDTLEGVILDMNNTRAYWEVEYDDGGEAFPDCFSNDGVRPAGNCESPQSDTCMSCKMSKFDENIGKYGKTPCKRSKQIHILFDGELLPHRLLLPPSNIKSADSYISSLTSKRIPFQLVNTKVWLKEAKNKGGIEYSEVQFEMLGVVENEDEQVAIKQTYMNMKPIMRVGAEKNHE